MPQPQSAAFAYLGTSPAPGRRDGAHFPLSCIWTHLVRLEEGMQKGMQKGRQEGKLEGRQMEREANILGMLREKIPMETISRITHYSLDQIQKLGKLHGLL